MFGKHLEENQIMCVINYKCKTIINEEEFFHSVGSETGYRKITWILRMRVILIFMVCENPGLVI